MANTKDQDQFIEEIKENARRDRRRVEKLCNSIMKMPSSEIEDGVDDGEEKEFDPAVGVAIAENIAMLTDALTKSNSQLVEIAKLEVKNKQAEMEDSLPEKESIFDDIDADAGTKN